MIRFGMGRTLMTQGIQKMIDDEHMSYMALSICLQRHSDGDWGDVCEEDKEANNRALKYGYRLLSSYHIDDTKIWIITEADRSVTTVLLPSEY